MGLDQTVTFPADKVPAWSAARDLLAARGFLVRLQMIDGQLAFPDEVPPDEWKELRFGTHAGMVTVRRSTDRLTLIVWGNADAGLMQVRNALSWAFALVTEGSVVLPEGPRSAAEFAQLAELPMPGP